MKASFNSYPGIAGSVLKVLIPTLILVCVTVSSVFAETRKVAYFEVGFTGRKNTFVIKLRDKQRILEARAFLERKQPSFGSAVIGRIVKAKVSYNKRWSYHLKPMTISFFELAVEVCDGSPLLVEKHLEEVGGALLPGNIWCPWSSYLKREVRRPR